MQSDYICLHCDRPKGEHHPTCDPNEAPWCPYDAPLKFRSAADLEAAIRADERERVAVWLLNDDTRLCHEESAPADQREHPFWWAADQLRNLK